MSLITRIENFFTKSGKVEKKITEGVEGIDRTIRENAELLQNLLAEQAGEVAKKTIQNEATIFVKENKKELILFGGALFVIIILIFKK